MLHFEGDKEFQRPAADISQKLGDARYLAECVPDVERLASVDAQQFVAVVRPGVSFVRGKMEITLRVLEVVPAQSIKYHVRGKSIGSTNQITAAIALTPTESGTRVHWVADITELGGLLKLVPKGLIQAAAQKVIADLWTCVESRLTKEKSEFDI